MITSEAEECSEGNELLRVNQEYDGKENSNMDEENKGSEVKKEDRIYEKAEQYWKTIEPSIDGMLGGFGNLSELDVRDSKKFLKMLMQKRQLGKAKAIDCGSGIGRVSKMLLLPLFDSVDMVDVNPNFIQASAEYLGPRLNERVEEKFTCGLQDFTAKEGNYDLIWIQWVSGHLTDPDFIDFFKRCKRGLKKNGVIGLKENIASSDEKDFDSQDHSYTRPRELVLKLFGEAGLEVIGERKQTNWPDGIYEVRMFALR